MTKKLVFVINSQQEFWRREIGGQIEEKGHNFVEKISEILNEGHCPVVQLDADFAELEALSSFPKNSLIGWCHSDERFDLAFNSRLATIESLALILRPYKLNSFKLSNLWSSLLHSLANSREVRSLQEVLQLIAWQIRGVRMQFRQSRVIRIYKQSGRKFANIPIGYTNIFARSFLEYYQVSKNSKELSLLEFNAQEPGFASTKVTFVGQEGQVVRKLAVRALGEKQLGSVIRRSKYGASNVFDASVIEEGAEYVSAMASSRFVLCPPGNISGETYRLYEAIVMNRMPLALNHVTCDPNFSSDITSIMGWSKYRSWRHLLDVASTLAVDKYEEALQKVRANAKEELLVLRRTLNLYAS